MTNTVTIGADPELFVGQVQKNTYKFVPICGNLGGTKERPIPIPGLDKGYMMQEDGPAAEFNIPPAKTAYEFGANISNALAALTKVLHSKNLVPLKDLRATTLSKEHFTSWPQLEQIGCDPDFYAYEGNPPEKGRGVPLLGAVRGVGGHIHIGYDKRLIPPNVLAKFLDITITIPMLHLDKQGARRRYYGLPGLYRDKSYGMEYRSLSNFWIWDKGYAVSIGETIFALINSIRDNLIGWQAFYNQVPWHRVEEAIVWERASNAKALMTTFLENNLYREVYVNV